MTNATNSAGDTTRLLIGGRRTGKTAALVKATADECERRGLPVAIVEDALDEPVTVSVLLDMVREARGLLETVTEALPDIRHHHRDEELLADHLLAAGESAASAWASATLAASILRRLPGDLS